MCESGNRALIIVRVREDVCMGLQINKADPHIPPIYQNFVNLLALIVQTLLVGEIE